VLVFLAVLGLILLIYYLIRGIILFIQLEKGILEVRIFLQFAFWRIPLFQAVYTAEKLRRAILESVLKAKKAQKKPIPALKIFKAINKYIKVKSLEVSVLLGTGEADKTAELCGGIFAVLAPFGARLLRRKKHAKVYVEPIFDRQTLSLHFECIFSLKIVHSIYNAIKIIRSEKKHGKASDRKHFERHHGESEVHD